MHISYPLENITSLVYSIVFFWFLILSFFSLSVSLFDWLHSGRLCCSCGKNVDKFVLLLPWRSWLLLWHVFRTASGWQQIVERLDRTKVLYKRAPGGEWVCKVQWLAKVLWIFWIIERDGNGTWSGSVWFNHGLLFDNQSVPLSPWPPGRKRLITGCCCMSRLGQRCSGCVDVLLQEVAVFGTRHLLQSHDHVLQCRGFPHGCATWEPENKVVGGSLSPKKWRLLVAPWTTYCMIWCLELVLQAVSLSCSS